MTRQEAAKGYAVLLVDDEVTYLHVMGANISAHASFSVVAMATNGDDAEDLCSRIQPDVAVLDVFMRDQTGFEVAARLLRIAPELRIVLVSAVPEAQFYDMARQLGALAFLPKKLLSADRLASLLSKATSFEGNP